MAVDLLTAAQDAAFKRLAEAMPSGLSAVFQHIPENTKPPFTVLGDISSEPGDEKGEESISFEVGYVYQGKGRLPLLEMMHAGRSALDAAAPFNAPPLDIEEVGTAAALWLSSEVFGADDGLTYGGVQRFSIGVEAA